MTKENKESTKKKKKWWLLILILLLIGITGGVYYYIQFINTDRLTRDQSALAGLLPGKTEAEIAELLSQKVAEGMVDIGVSGQPSFEDRGAKGNLGIENIPGNRYALQVDLVLDETGEILYQSGLIDPGYYIEYVGLNRELEPGPNSATVVFTTYTMDGKNDEIAKTKVQILLNIAEGTYYK